MPTFRRGDYVKTKEVLTLIETNGFSCISNFEGSIIKGNPLTIEVEGAGGMKWQIRIADEALDKIELVKAANIDGDVKRKIEITAEILAELEGL